MVEFFKTINNKIAKIDSPEQNCWINVSNPTDEEISQIVGLIGVDDSFIKAALDEEETSRVEADEGNVLVIVDVPYTHKDEETVIYETMPLGMIITDDYFVTVCLRDYSVINDIEDGYVKNVQTAHKTQFMLTLLLKTANRYLQYLHQIDKYSIAIEKRLQVSMKNKELIQMLDLEKSLIYFTTSLRADETTLNKILKGRYIKLYEEDKDLLDDVLIEIAQAIEMSQIYSSILIGTSDALASIISNNLNIVMKRFTLISILFAIPTIVTGFYGMNIVFSGESTPIPLAQFWWVPLIISGIGILITWLILRNDRMMR
ncbi:MAG: magnesium transporter [Clostridiales bacterium]|nr:MAG: magnesium transporter [Clostridiales bacterium]